MYTLKLSRNDLQFPLTLWGLLIPVSAKAVTGQTLFVTEQISQPDMEILIMYPQ